MVPKEYEQVFGNTVKGKGCLGQGAALYVDSKFPGMNLSRYRNLQKAHLFKKAWAACVPGEGHGYKGNCR